MIKINKTNLRFTPYVCFGVALATASTHAQTLIQNNFDGGAATGPSFQEVSNGVGTNSAYEADPATGTITTGDNAQNSTGLKASGTTTIAPSATGFTVEWVIGSAAFVSNDFANNTPGTVNGNGFFIGMVDNTETGGNPGLFNNAANTFGFTIFSEDWSAGNIASFENFDDTTTTSTSTGVAMPTAAEVNDGFTLSMTLNSDDTWSAFTTGLDNDINTTGTVTAGLYNNLAGSLVPYTSVQGEAITYTANSVTVNAIPEPSTYALLFGTVVLGLGVLRRRLR